MKLRNSIIILMWIVFEVSVAGPLGPYSTTEKVSTSIVSSEINMRAHASMMDWIKNVVADGLLAGSNMLRGTDPNRGHNSGGGRFAGGTCDCKKIECICCSSLNVFGLDTQTCTQLIYDSTKSTIHMHVKTENHEHESSFPVSKANTKCIPIHVPYMDQKFLDICVGLYNISEPHEGLLHLCMVANGRLEGQSVVTLYYDCMDMGENAAAYRPTSYELYDKNVPGIYHNIFPSTSPIPPPGEVVWAPPKKIKREKYISKKDSAIVQGLATFLAKWLF